MTIAVNSPETTEQAIAEAFAVGRLDDALTAAQTLNTAHPERPFGWKARGAVLWRLGRGTEARPLLEQAARLSPTDPEVHNLLGLSWMASGLPEPALAWYQRALRLAPHFADALSNQGAALHALGRWEEARASLEQAIRASPQLADAHYNLGCLLGERGEPDAALRCLEQAIALAPGHARAHHNLGALRARAGALTEALAAYRQALSLDPQLAEAHNSLGSLLADLGQTQQALNHYAQALHARPAYRSAASNRLFALAGHPGCPPAAYRREARAWEQQCLDPGVRAQAAERRLHPPALTDRPLRLGVVSAEFGQHAVAHFLLPVLAALDPDRVRLHLYPTVAREDAITARFRTLLGQDQARWTPLCSLDDAQAAARIQADGIDVLLDTSGHTAGHRLGVFAQRAAPVQCHYIGYFASTGLSAMDYLLADSMLAPPDLDAHFSETLWRLPRCWQVYDPLHDAPPPHWHPDPQRPLTLGSFTNLAKVNDATLILWAQVLHALPEARLLLKDRHAQDPLMRERLLRVLTAQGIDSERIVLRGRDPDWTAHMASYAELDIALETLSHNSCTTACDALWMGVPVITLAGDRLGGRLGAALLTGLGRPEWIARDAEDYVARVVALAKDEPRRRALRLSLREEVQASALGDATGLARALEAAWTSIIGNHRHG